VSAPGRDERARLFVAAELPGATRAELERWGSEAVRGVTGVRALAAESLHVTLCFLGWREAREIDAIAAACEAALDGQEPTKLSIGQPMWLPSRGPRVLAVILDDPSGNLARIQQLAGAALSAAGWYVRETRAYLPHVTLARVGRGTRVGRVELTPPPASSFAAGVVTLFRSRLGRDGARYEALHRIELGRHENSVICGD
jgi:2'-5' RNA ligase